LFSTIEHTFDIEVVRPFPRPAGRAPRPRPAPSCRTGRTRRGPMDSRGGSPTGPFCVQTVAS